MSTAPAPGAGKDVMYRLRLLRLIECGDGDVWLYRDLELPFPPYAGLGLKMVMEFEDADGWSMDYIDPIREVAWDVPRGLFIGYLDPMERVDWGDATLASILDDMAPFTPGWAVVPDPDRSEDDAP